MSYLQNISSNKSLSQLIFENYIMSTEFIQCKSFIRFLYSKKIPNPYNLDNYEENIDNQDNRIIKMNDKQIEIMKYINVFNNDLSLLKITLDLLNSNILFYRCPSFLDINLSASQSSELVDYINNLIIINLINRLKLKFEKEYGINEPYFYEKLVEEFPLSKNIIEKSNGNTLTYPNYTILFDQLVKLSGM
jgi:hypothetical protein